MNTPMDSNTKHRSGELKELLSAAYAYTREGDFENAEASLEAALRADFEDDEVVSSLKCVHFWKERFDKFVELVFQSCHYFLILEELFSR